MSKKEKDNDLNLEESLDKLIAVLKKNDPEADKEVDQVIEVVKNKENNS